MSKNKEKFNLKVFDDFPDWVLEDLRKSGLEDDIIKEMGVFPIRNKDELKNHLGFASVEGQPLLQTTEAYAIPYQAKGFTRVKLKNPIDGKSYRSPSKIHYSGYHAYFLPKDRAKLAKQDVPLVLVEGEKKTAKLSQEARKAGENLAVLGFPGISQWRDCPEWNHIPLSGRTVYIAFDSDFTSKIQVKQQLIKLWLFLMKKNAIPKIWTWNLNNKGIDDHLCTFEDCSVELVSLMGRASEEPFSLCSDVPIQKIATMCANLKFGGPLLGVLHGQHNFLSRYNVKINTFKQLVSAAHESALPSFMDGKKLIAGKAAEMFVQKFSGNLMYAAEHFWIYEKDRGVWRQKSDRQIKNYIKDFLGIDYATKNNIEEIIYLTQIDKNIFKNSDFEFCQDRSKINLKNGVFCLKEWKLLPHSRKYYFSTQLNVNYNPEASCFRWQSFLEEIELSGESQQRLKEWFGYGVTSETRLEKFLLLFGDGADGKSRVLNAFKRMIGKESLVSVDPSNLFANFETFRIYGKTANVVGDIDAETVVSQRFKKVVSGETITADIKFKNSVTFAPFCKHFFSTNNMPPTKDRSHGYFRRVDIIKFPRKFVEAEQDRMMDEKLEKEIDGIFLWALEGLKQIIDNEWKFSPSQEIDDNLTEYKAHANPLISYLTDEEVFQGKKAIESKEIRDGYKEYCAENGHKPLSSSKLGTELTRLGLEKTRRRVNGKRVYLYEVTPKFHEEMGAVERIEAKHDREEEQASSAQPSWIEGPAVPAQPRTAGTSEVSQDLQEIRNMRDMRNRLFDERKE